MKEFHSKLLELLDETKANQVLALIELWIKRFPDSHNGLINKERLLDDLQDCCEKEKVKP